MWVKDFIKDIRFQLANDTLINPSNCLKKLSKNLGERTIHQKMLLKAIHVPKKTINFDFINDYKVSPHIAGQKSRSSRPNSKTYLIKIHSVVPPCQTIEVFNKIYRIFSKIQQKECSCSLKNIRTRYKSSANEDYLVLYHSPKLFVFFYRKSILVLSVK